MSETNLAVRKANSEIVSRIAANGRLRGGSDSAVLGMNCNHHLHSVVMDSWIYLFITHFIISFFLAH